MWRMTKRDAERIINDLLNQPDAAQKLADAIVADFDAAAKRHQVHCAKIDALEKPQSMRWCISAAGTQGRMWVKTVRWDESKPGWVLKSATFTAKRIQAGCFLPECATAIAKSYSNLVDLKFERP